MSTVSTLHKVTPLEKINLIGVAGTPATNSLDLTSSWILVWSPGSLKSTFPPAFTGESSFIVSFLLPPSSYIFQLLFPWPGCQVSPCNRSVQHGALPYSKQVLFSEESSHLLSTKLISSFKDETEGAEGGAGADGVQGHGKVQSPTLLYHLSCCHLKQCRHIIQSIIQYKILTTQPSKNNTNLRYSSNGAVMSRYYIKTVCSLLASQHNSVLKQC